MDAAIQKSVVTGRLVRSGSAGAESRRGTGGTPPSAGSAGATGAGSRAVCDRLVVVGIGDGIDDLGLVEVGRPFDHRDETASMPSRMTCASSSAVLLDPDRFARIGERDPHAELIHALFRRACVDAARPKGVDDSLCPVLVHTRKLPLLDRPQKYRTSESDVGMPASAEPGEPRPAAFGSRQRSTSYGCQALSARRRRS